MGSNSQNEIIGIIKDLIANIFSEMTKGGELQLTFSVPKTAKLLGINEVKMYEMVRRKSFPSIKFGKRIVIPVLQLLMWIDNEAWGENDKTN